MLDLVVLAGVGVLAGVVTTVAGMGGGMVLVLALSVFMDPILALAVSSPALLLANGHRLWMYRSELPRREGLWLVLGGVPGAFLGGLFAVGLPESVIRAAMIGMAVLAVLRSALKLAWRPGRVWNPLAAGVTGFVSATTGGGGLILGPYLLARGLSGVPYVACAALAALSIHAARILAYGAGGVGGLDTLAKGLALALLIALGNLLGELLRRWLGAGRQKSVQVAVMVGCLGLALLGA